MFTSQNCTKQENISQGPKKDDTEQFVVCSFSVYSYWLSMSVLYQCSERESWKLWIWSRLDLGWTSSPCWWDLESLLNCHPHYHHIETERSCLLKWLDLPFSTPTLLSVVFQISTKLTRLLFIQKTKVLNISRWLSRTTTHLAFSCSALPVGCQTGSASPSP